MASTANVTLRLPTELLERIDQAALQANTSRTEYMLSWLPVRYDSTTKPRRKHGNTGRRASSAGSESSPSRVDTDA